MALTAAAIAQTKVASLAPEAPLENAYRLFVDEQISGAPVIDDVGRVIGVVSSADLLRFLVDVGESDRPLAGYIEEELLSASEFGELPDAAQARLQESVVGDVMTDRPITVESDTPVRDVAAVMRDSGVHRVIVVKGGTLLGIISTMDVVGLLADGRAID